MPLLPGALLLSVKSLGRDSRFLRTRFMMMQA